MLLLRREIIDLILTSGQFSPQDATVTAHVLFILLFFSSKAFFVPQAICITELIGLYVLGGSIQVSLVAAALLVWNLIRIWLPTVIAGAAVIAIRGKIRI